MAPTLQKWEHRYKCKTRKNLFRWKFKEMDLCKPDAAIHKAFPLAEQIVLHPPFLFVSCLASITHRAISSVQRCHKKTWLWKAQKQRKRRELNPNEQSGTLRILRSPASRKEHGKLGCYRWYHVRTENSLQKGFPNAVFVEIYLGL